MVNYGYEPETVGWKEERKHILADRLDELLRQMQKDFQERGEKWPFPPPCIEVDGLYRGVRMRKLTHLGEKAIDDICDSADEVYKTVMEIGVITR